MGFGLDPPPPTDPAPPPSEPVGGLVLVGDAPPVEPDVFPSEARRVQRLLNPILDVGGRLSRIDYRIPLAQPPRLAGR